jgi:hypothetical protein
MNLKKILSIAALSFAGFMPVHGEEAVIPVNYDKNIILNEDKGTLYVGHDTDGDGYGDLVECYTAVDGDKVAKTLVLELSKVFQDKNKNHKIEINKGELIWKNGDKVTKEIARKKVLFFNLYPYQKIIPGLVSFGYDTNGDSYEDSRGFYQPVGNSEGQIILEKISSYCDKNNNHQFEEDEMEGGNKSAPDIDIPLGKINNI